MKSYIYIYFVKNVIRINLPLVLLKNYILNLFEHLELCYF